MKTAYTDPQCFYHEQDGNQYILKARALMYYEANYGADADGNRGMGVWFLDEVECIEWYINDKEVEEQDVPEKIQDILYDTASNDEWKS